MLNSQFYCCEERLVESVLMIQFYSDDTLTMNSGKSYSTLHPW